MRLVPITAYYRDSSGSLAKVQPFNALMAEDVAPKWAAFRAEAAGRGWELLISPPSSGDYTRAIFRTPEDAQWLLDNGQVTAATVDNSAHQAGRAVDLDLGAMAQSYPSYNYGDLVAMAARHGLVNRVYKANGSEPWHFDDDPVGAGIFSSMRAAVDAIGNTSSQVAAAVSAGLDTPQIQGMRAALLSPAGLVAGGAVLLLVGFLVYRTFQGGSNGRNN